MPSCIRSHERIVCIGIPGVEPVKVELTDFKTKEVVDTLEVDAVLVATGRAPFTQVRAPTCLAHPCNVWRPDPHSQCAPRHSVVELPTMEQSDPLL